MQKRWAARVGCAHVALKALQQRRLAHPLFHAYIFVLLQAPPPPTRTIALVRARGGKVFHRAVRLPARLRRVQLPHNFRVLGGPPTQRQVAGREGCAARERGAPEGPPWRAAVRGAGGGTAAGGVGRHGATRGGAGGERRGGRVGGHRDKQRALLLQGEAWEGQRGRGGCKRNGSDDTTSRRRTHGVHEAGVLVVLRQHPPARTPARTHTCCHSLSMQASMKSSNAAAALLCASWMAVTLIISCTWVDAAGHSVRGAGATGAAAMPRKRRRAGKRATVQGLYHLPDGMGGQKVCNTCTTRAQVPPAAAPASYACHTRCPPAAGTRQRWQSPQQTRPHTWAAAQTSAAPAATSRGRRRGQQQWDRRQQQVAAAAAASGPPSSSSALHQHAPTWSPFYSSMHCLPA